jgi:hypothetical protein
VQTRSCCVTVESGCPSSCSPCEERAGRAVRTKRARRLRVQLPAFSADERPPPTCHGLARREERGRPSRVHVLARAGHPDHRRTSAPPLGVTVAALLPLPHPVRRASGFRFSAAELVVGLGFTLAWHRELKQLREGDVFVWVGAHPGEGLSSQRTRSASLPAGPPTHAERIAGRRRQRQALAALVAAVSTEHCHCRAPGARI